jgi:hypothetical protein
MTDVEDRLYGSDLDEFVKERTAAARELRGDGRREDAAAVAKLPKPSVAAWIVNRVARDEPGLVSDLLDAGAGLREVQLAAGSAADLRAAAEGQEAALRVVMRAAERVATGRGAATAGTLDRVRETLHAAALDADLAEQVRRGVLVREQRAVGFPLGVTVPVERRRAPAARAARTERTAPPPPRRRDEVAAKRVQRAAAAAEAAREGLSNAEADLSQARKTLEARALELGAAREAVAAAERRADEAHRDVERAEKAHAGAGQTAARAAERLQELTARRPGRRLP